MKTKIKSPVRFVILIILYLSALLLSSCAKEDNWSKATIISHACGGIDKHSYTNSAEALDLSISEGFYAIEIDFRYTSDGTLICAHDWEDLGLEVVPSLEDFMKFKINDLYTPLTAEQALEKLVNTGISLVVDTKEDDAVKVYKEIDTILSSIKNGEKYKEFLIPQIYYKEDFSAIKGVYDYKNYIFSVYKLKLTKDKQFEDIAQFCKDNGITTLTVPKKKVTDERIKIIKDKGLRIATHTVNSKKDRESFTEMGVDILYSDFLKEK